MVGTSGTHECGRVWRVFKEERFAVTGCNVTLEANTPMTVRVWTSLDGDADDESFAISNVVIELLQEGNTVVICVRGMLLVGLGKVTDCTRVIAISIYAHVDTISTMPTVAKNTARLSTEGLDALLVESSRHLTGNDVQVHLLMHTSFIRYLDAYLHVRTQ